MSIHPENAQRGLSGVWGKLFWLCCLSSSVQETYLHTPHNRGVSDLPIFHFYLLYGMYYLDK